MGRNRRKFRIEKNKDLSALENPERVLHQLELVIRNYFRTHQTFLTGRAKVFKETLKKHISEAEQKGFAQKAVIFTEYVRTLNYIQDLLGNDEFKDFQIIVYHGGLSNLKDKDGTSPRDRALELFRHADKAILIATEAGAEGLNLQFCNLLINYDLPWNPQRIEQRIGRCHRYGQKNDVIVMNFVCQENDAECHIFKILSEKFNLFDGIFGASNSILGAVQSGFELEKFFAHLYLNIRSQKEVEKDLEDFLETSETSRKEGIREVAKKLLEEFDPDVTKILKINWEQLKEEVKLNLSVYEKKLAQFIQSEIEGKIDNQKHAFKANNPKYKQLSARWHIFLRLYASDDLPLITTKHSDVVPVINQYKNLHEFKFSHQIKLSNDLSKAFNFKGAGYWLSVFLWKVEGANNFEQLHFLLLEPNGQIIESPKLRDLFECLAEDSAKMLHDFANENPFRLKLEELSGHLSEKNEQLSQETYNELMRIKQNAREDQTNAAENLRTEIRQISAEFDLQLLKAPMKEKGKVMKERDAKISELQKELQIYEETIENISIQEKNLNLELIKKFNEGKVSHQEILRIHLEFI